LLIFADTPAAFAGAGVAGEVARIGMTVRADAPSTVTALRFIGEIPNDVRYQGVRGTAVANTDGQSIVPYFVNGTITIRPPGVADVLDYLLGRTQTPPVGADANGDGRLDISDVVTGLAR
jgi:hypothetical protein